jgi:hypothetical protein
MIWQDEKKLNTARNARELSLSLSLSLTIYIYYKTEQNMENTPGTQQQ